MTSADRETCIAGDDLERMASPLLWLRRGRLALFAIAAVMTLARWEWGRLADARLNATLLSLHARGVPTRAADFEASHTPVPDAQNAAVALHAAALAVRIPMGLVHSSGGLLHERPWTADAGKFIPQLVTANAEAIRLARTAIDQQGVDWHLPGDPTAAEADSFAIIELPAQEILAQVLGEAANLARRRGNISETIEDLLALFRISDAALAGPATLRCHAVAAEIAHNAVIGSGSVARSILIDAGTAALARRLLDRLCDERRSRDAAVRAMYGEAFTGVVKITTHSFPFGPELLVRPMYLLDAERVLRVETDSGVAALECDSKAGALAIFPGRAERSYSILSTAAHTLSSHVTPWVRSTVDLYFEQLRLRRQAAVILSMKLFTFDHGRPPRDLDELIPKYLPAVPVDGKSGVRMAMRSGRLHMPEVHPAKTFRR